LRQHYGTVKWLGGETRSAWVLKLAPHVALRAKRVFARVAREVQKEICLTDTLEVCRDLAWFLERFPATMSTEDRKRLEERAAEHEAREERVLKILDGKAKTRRYQLAIPPRPYQQMAADIAIATGGLLLADELGLGKSCAAICMLVDPVTRPALVVTQTHLVKQWEREIARFAPPLKVHVIKRGEAYDIAPEIDVLICTYMKLFGWSTALQGKIKSVVYDEVQELRRGAEAKKGQAAFDISDSVDYRLGLTATPIYNYGGEAWAIIRAIQPNALGDYEEFVTEWCTGIDSKGRAKLKAPRTFGNYLRSSGIMLRRTRKDVGREIPSVTRVSHAIDCDQKPLREIESAAGELAEIILGGTKRTDADEKTAEMRLDNMVRQATGVGKAPHVADFVETLLEQGEKVVLFAWHRSVYSILEERLAAYKPARYSGSESPNQKEEARRRFVEGETPVFIMSLRSGAGLDGLQHVCRTVVFAELDWSPGVHEQCEGRVARDGQTEPVVVYYLVSEDGSDPLMEDVLGVKRAQVEGLRNPERDVMEKQISGDHIQRLARTYVTKRRSA
jgi:SNF2 family DNA or RNA helicase